MNPLIGQIGYRMFRAWGWPVVMPLNYTISVTARCNYRCATCRIYQASIPEMGLDDYRKLFFSLGRSPYWVTFSGGEPFLRQDLKEIVDAFCLTCRPKLVNIPTNGSFPERSAIIARDLARRYPDIDFIINVSLDSTGEEQNSIRGSPSAWDDAVATIESLKRERPANLVVGIGTVISKKNIDGFWDRRKILSALGADSMVAEVAETRAELLNDGLDITPSPEQYLPIADRLIEEIKSGRLKGWPGLAQSFRKQYYRYVLTVLRGGSGLPCYAGHASVQIMPDGEVWACCLKGDRMGNLSHYGFDFRKLWRSDQAGRVRRDIRTRKCACPLANAAYTNMIMDLPSAVRVVRDQIF